MSTVIEHCFLCDEPTGSNGRRDDSRYDLRGNGPYCENCYEQAPSEDKEKWVTVQARIGGER